MLTGVVSAVITAAASYFAGDQGLTKALMQGVVVGLLTGVVPPYIEALYWFVGRDRVLLEEENARLRAAAAERLEAAKKPKVRKESSRDDSR